MDNSFIVNEYFINLRTNNSLINDFFYNFEKNNVHFAVLGGAVRAALNNSNFLRDIDIVFDFEDSLIYNFLQSYNIKYNKNSFDGFKFSLDNIEFDVWNINNHFAFKNQIYKTSFDNIIKTTFLNYDSILFDFTNNQLFSDSYQKCIEKRYLDLVGSSSLNSINPNMPLSIWKILQLSNANNYVISRKTKKYISDYCKGLTYNQYMTNIQDAYEKHYKKIFNNQDRIFLKHELQKITK